MKKPLLGAHVSTAGGFYNGIIKATEIGANVIQIFGASPRQWRAPMPSTEVVEKFLEVRGASDVAAIYLHAPYLCNLASPNEEVRAKAVINLSAHMEIGNRLEASGLIFHIGSGKELPKEEAMKSVADGMKAVLKNTREGSCMLLMENGSGGGGKLGSTAEDVGMLFKKVGSDRVGVCFDTAHAFGAGLIEEYSVGNIKELFDEWESEVGLKNIKAMHINDSKAEFDTKKDRHENLGEGFIGLDGFKNLAKETRLHHAAWMLEVPGFDGTGPDKKNVDLLKGCF